MFDKNAGEFSRRSLFFGKGIYMIDFNDKITELSVEEYFFLTENFETAGINEINKGVSYIVNKRKRNIVDTVGKVLQNELNDFERAIALDYWGKEMTVEEMLRKHKISKSAFYRTIDGIKEKVEIFMRYVLVYENISKKLSAVQLLEYIGH